MASPVSLGVQVAGFHAASEAIEKVMVGYSPTTEALVGVGAEYGAYVELGTSRMRAQPYLFPAVETVMRTEFARISFEARGAANPGDFIITELARAIEEEAKRNAPVDTGFLKGSIKWFEVS